MLQQLEPVLQIRLMLMQIYPNATTTVLGKIQLSGDFDSTSTATQFL